MKPVDQKCIAPYFSSVVVGVKWALPISGLHVIGGCECGGKCLALPITLATVFIFFAVLYISESYKGSIVIFSLVADRALEQEQNDSLLAQYFPSSLVDWLHACQQIAPLVLLDPVWLQCLSKRSKSCLNNESSKTTVKFALINEEPSLPNWLIQRVTNASMGLGWRRSKSAPSFNSTLITKDNVTIVISLMELRKYYWYVHETHDEPPRAFRGLNLTEFGSFLQNDNGFLLPDPIDFYLWQWPRSRFLECNRSSAMYLRKKYPLLYAAPPVIQDSFVQVLAYARDIFTSHRVTIMLAGGTALGWYRECGIIPHTTDTDMAFLASEYKPEIEEELKRDKIFKLHWILGKAEDGIELTVYAHGNKIDIFGIYEASNGSYVGAMMTGERIKLRWWYPKFDGVCTGDLKEQLFYVRCDVVAVFEREYGPVWYEHHHSNNYVWHSSHYNVQRLGKYSDAEWPYVYRTFS